MQRLINRTGEPSSYGHRRGSTGAVSFGQREGELGRSHGSDTAGVSKRTSIEVNVNIVYNVYMSATAPLGRPVSVRLPEDLRDRVEALAKATRRSQGDIVREVLERDLSSLEWEQRIIARASDLRSGRVQAVPLAVIERELGLSDVPVDSSILDEIE